MLCHVRFVKTATYLQEIKSTSQIDNFYSCFQVKHLKFGPKDEDIKESAICIVSPHEVTTTMTTLTLGTTIVLYIFPMIFLPILYTK